MQKSMKRTASLIGSTLAAIMLAGCGLNGGAQIPSITQANLSKNQLQVAVGTANIGQDGTVGLNVVTTLRQPNGLSAVLADQPTITGPAGFVVPANVQGAYGGAGVDAGTNHISGSPQVARNVTPVNSTLGTFTGAFSYGFGPFNCDQNCTNVSAYYPGNPNASPGNGFQDSIYDGSSMIVPFLGFDPTQPLPFFSAGTPFDYLVGPPAEPFFNDGTFPVGFAGYSPGIEVFEMTPVAGQYSLSVNVAAQNAKPVTYNANAMLTSTAVLGATSVTVTSETPAGGLSGTVNVPAGVTETEVFVVDASRGLFYTILVNGVGAQAWQLPGTLGPCVGSGCQNGGGAAASLNPGDSYFVAAVGYDYPAFEAGPPGNKQVTPTITGANGQADITMSPIVGPNTY